MPDEHLMQEVQVAADMATVEGDPTVFLSHVVSELVRRGNLSEDSVAVLLRRIIDEHEQAGASLRMWSGDRLYSLTGAVGWIETRTQRISEAGERERVWDVTLPGRSAPHSTHSAYKSAVGTLSLLQPVVDAIGGRE